VGSIAVVTGAASGIGRALMSALIGRGDTVIAVDISDNHLRDPPRGASAGRAIGVVCDVRDAEALGGVVSDAARRYGALDLIFNNAGVGVGGPLEDLTTAHWDRIIDVNLRGVINGVQAAYPIMQAQGHGHIVNTASMAGLIPFPLGVPYATTKWGVVGLSLSLRAEAAQFGVHVSVVCPGFVDTPLIDRDVPADLPPTRLAGHTRSAERRFSIGPMLKPEQLAQQVLRGLARNRAVIIAPRRVRVAWWAQRLSSGFTQAVATSGSRRTRATIEGGWPS